MDSTLNVQQYIQQCIHNDPSDIDTILKAPPGQEEGVWKYEHVRQFCMQLNGLALLLQVNFPVRCNSTVWLGLAASLPSLSE